MKEQKITTLTATVAEEFAFSHKAVIIKCNPIQLPSKSDL